ncbi:hypothetical protein A6R68_03077 [Neotoma lepida]|uniref:Uncharacterized protein n=1 Tax=Neotoma lepida TaxID=56216 RepID=A0A1A6GQ10_NEOLE|nr:hypothetical protein A6R68_03077 [Neotoma lepida]
MDEPPQEAPDGSLNHESTAQSPNNQTTHIEEGAGQAPHRGSADDGVGSSEQSSDKASNQIANAESEKPLEEASQPTVYRSPGHTDKTSQQVDRRASGQAERRMSQQIERRLSGQAERRMSQVDRRSGQAERRMSQKVDRRSSQAERRTSEPPSQQLPSLLEGTGSEKIDDQVALAFGGETSEQAEQGTWEHDEHTLLHQDDDRTLGKSEYQVYNQADFLAEDYTEQHRFSVDVERGSDRIKHETEKQADYRSYYKTLAQAENRSLPEIDDNKEMEEADFKIQSCTFEDSQTDLKSKVSTGGETESTTTVQAFTLHDTEFISDTQSSHEKLPSITTKVYYTSSQTTEITTDIRTETEQKKSFQRHGQTYTNRFPPIVYEDPYQVALRYMEKHNILQIFQITENLVYEKPDDPLYFMLEQVQNMIRHREQRRNI